MKNGSYRAKNLQAWGDLDALQSELGQFSEPHTPTRSTTSMSASVSSRFTSTSASTSTPHSMSSSASTSMSSSASMSTSTSSSTLTSSLSPCPTDPSGTCTTALSTPTPSSKTLRPAMTATSCAVYNSTLMLECLEDMVLQEIAAVEAVLADYCQSMCDSPSMNTYTVRRRAMYPFSAQ